MSNIIILTGADGRDYECRVLKLCEFDGKVYGLLQKLDDGVSVRAAGQNAAFNSSRF